MEKKFCEKCGKELDKDSKICGECDTKKDEDKVIITYEPKKDYSVLDSRTKSDNGVRASIISSLITFILCFIVMYVYTNYFNKPESTTTTRLERDVTITDEGIAEAVDKIYDAVVVVENYNSMGTLQSTGSGFVYKSVDDKSYILTNQHVVEKAGIIKLVFTDNRRVEATIIGGDVYSDIAVLNVNKNDIVATATIGSSESLRVGDTTFAVGAPFDTAIYSWTVTRGILSGKNRLVEVALSNYYSYDYVMEVLQTDTAINSGNSGGPLCNSNGEVIGITNMKISSSSVEGMGFAIPIETAIKYADIYISGKTVTRPYLGVSMYDYTSRDNVKGIYIQSIENGSPAGNSGLKSGDIIIKIDDVSVETSSYLKYELYKHEVGDTITLTYLRNGKEYTTKVVLKTSI